MSFPWTWGQGTSQYRLRMMVTKGFHWSLQCQASYTCNVLSSWEVFNASSNHTNAFLMQRKGKGQLRMDFKDDGPERNPVRS